MEGRPTVLGRRGADQVKGCAADEVPVRRPTLPLLTGVTIALAAAVALSHTQSRL